MVMAKLKTALEKMKYLSRTKWAIEGKGLLDWAVITTLIEVLVSSTGSSLIENSLVQGQEWWGFFNQPLPTCQSQCSPIYFETWLFSCADIRYIICGDKIKNFLKIWLFNNLFSQILYFQYVSVLIPLEGIINNSSDRNRYWFHYKA